MNTIEHTAAQWLMRIQAGDVTESDLLEWEAWLNADTRHKKAFDAVESASVHIAREQPSLSDIPLPSEIELRADTYDGEQSVSTHLDTLTRQPAYRWAIAASVILAAGLLAINTWWTGEPDTSLQVLETLESEHRSLDLDDGSRIVLGAASSLSVNYSAERRTVVLEAGEALFEVAKDRERPFVVLAGSGTITAVGTAFNVRRDLDRVVVTVTEGEVEVVQQPNPITAGTDATLTMGERVEYSTRGMEKLEDVEPEMATAWQNGRLRYRGEALKHVIPDVDRYSTHTVIIGDSAVGELEFTGTVFQDNADEWLQSLERVFPVEVVELDDEQLLLRLRK